MQKIDHIAVKYLDTNYSIKVLHTHIQYHSMSSVIDDMDIIHHPLMDGITGMVLDVGHSSARTLSDIMKGKGADETLTSLTVHYCASLAILDGLSAFPNLRVLMLIDCTSLVDLTPLKDVPSLEVLSITGSNVVHLDVLENHPKLRVIDAAGCNKLDDIWGLRNCTELSFAALSGTSVASIAPLTNCNDLEQVDISTTLVGDLTPLTGKTKLIALDASDTPSCECEALQSCRALVRLALTNIRRIAPLCGLPELSQLYIANAHFTDPMPLKACPQLMIVSIITSDDKDLDIPFLEDEDDDESALPEDPVQEDIDQQLAEMLDSESLGDVMVSQPDPDRDYTAQKTVAENDDNKEDSDDVEKKGNDIIPEEMTDNHMTTRVTIRASNPPPLASQIAQLD